MNRARHDAGTNSELSALREEVARLTAELASANALIAADEALRATLFVEVRAANEELLLSSLSLTSALDAAQTGAFRWEVHGSAIACDASLARLLSGSELTPPATFDAFLAGVHPDDRHELRARFTECSLGLGDIAYEFRRAWLDDSVHWLSVRGHLEITREDSPVVVGVFSDITERKLADAAHTDAWVMEEAERRYRTLSDAMPQLVWTAQPSGRWSYANKQWLAYTGLSAARSLSEGLNAALFEDDRASVLAAWQRSLDTGAPFHAQGRLRGRDGRYRWFQLEAVAVHDQRGAIACWLGSCTDCEGQKTAQDELARTARAKADFLAMVAHELRNPLESVASALRVLRAKTVTTAASECALAEHHLSHLSGLVDELHDVARVVRGKIVLKREWHSLNSLVAEASAEAGSEIDERGHLLDLALESDNLMVYGDAMRLKQVFANLLGNSAQYTPDGGYIRLSARYEAGCMEIEVVDNGVGMSASLLPKVFDLFVQGDRGHGCSAGGLGVGLTLARSLVELHGGTISASSEGPGKGSVFEIRLPFAAQGRLD